MKKCFKLFAAALMALTMFMPAQANEELTICNGNTTSSYIPFKPIDFQDAGMHSQLIYPAELLTEMNGQQINSITFYLQDTDGMYAADGQLVVKMGETDNTTYASAADFRTGLVQVAAMPLTAGVTELVIEFNSPYNYQGGNLVLDFTNPEQGDDNYYAWNHWYGQTTTYYSAIGSNGAMDKFLPKATINYGVPQEWAATVTPLGLNFNIPAEREEVQTIVVRNKGLNPFTPVISSLSAPLSIEADPVELATGESLEIRVKFAPTEICNCWAKLTINCGDAGTFEVIIDAIATAPVYEVTVGDQATTNEFLPIRGYYMDEVGTYGQMIYTEEMMGAAKGNKITKVTFYPRSALSSSLANGKIQLSFKNVEGQIEFAEATALTEMTAVANCTINGGETQLVFVLDEPYQYDGGSLAIEALAVQRSTSFASTLFYGDNYDYLPSMYHFASTTKTSNFLPMATFTYDKSGTPQPEVLKGDVNGDHEVNISDAIVLISAILNSDMTGVNLLNADVDENQEVNITDAIKLINFVLNEEW
ncbi:MAG: dockerin type I repeat-containing protein [Muribaculaceae bacterium]|nr:dockerin type I repeat-containing protein [Muribaculaceae bacterium]